MRISEVSEGDMFKTRLTNRFGIVSSSTEKEVVVTWRDSDGVKALHPDIQVDYIVTEWSIN